MSPFFDRYWWLRLTPAVVVLVVSGFFVNFVLQESAHLNEKDAFFSLSVVIGFFAALNVLYLILFTRRALQARARKRTRIAVLQGRIAADAILSSSTIEVDPARAPHLEAEPFSALHAPRRRARTNATPANLRFRWPARVLLVVILLLLFTPFVSDWYDRYLQSGQSLDQYLWGMVVFVSDAASGLWSLSSLSLAVLLPLVGLLVFIAYGVAVGLVSRVRGVAYGVTATSEGLTEITPLGRRRFVRWEEARLWEVTVGGRGALYGQLHRLSSPTNAVEWTGAIGGASSSMEDASATESDEALERQQALLDLVAARTGLWPRTYATVLKASGAREIKRHLRREAIIASLITAFCLIGIAVAVVVAPFVPDLALNATIAGAYGVAALITLGLVVYEVARQWRLAHPPPNASEPYQGPVVPRALSDSAIYIVNQSKPVVVRMAIVLASSLALAAGIIGYFAFRQALSGTDFFNDSIDHMIWTALLEVALFLGGFVAIVMLVTFSMASTVFLRADQEKLSMFVGVLTVEAASWEKIERILIETWHGRAVTYQAFGRRNRLLARWDVERWRHSRRVGIRDSR